MKDYTQLQNEYKPESLTSMAEWKLLTMEEIQTLKDIYNRLGVIIGLLAVIAGAMLSIAART